MSWANFFRKRKSSIPKLPPAVLFKRGEVVKLKSGGPKMTIKDYVPDGSLVDVLCVWFDGNGHLMEKVFRQNLLIRCSETNS